VKETWLTSHQERLVETWIKGVMHMGNTTTNKYDYICMKIV